jgi:2-keto-3-deoxy-L-rhamnonate aldolase RhmA
MNKILCENRVIYICMICLVMCSLVWAQNTQSTKPATGNSVKAKLLAGEKVIGGTLTTTDPLVCRTMAGAGFEFLWIEMQHSPYTFETVANLIWYCQGQPALPFVRVPEVEEGSIQKALDIAAMGIIIPMCDTPEQARKGIWYAKYPPEGHRSIGGRAGYILGEDYRQTANENILIIVQIETMLGVENVEEIAAVEGVDVVFAAAADLSSFSGYRPGDPEYEKIIDKIRNATLAAGKWLGGPVSWYDREGFSFFQASSEGTYLRRGVHDMLEKLKDDVSN